MYLLDTNVVSELRWSRPHGVVVAWVRTVRDGSAYLRRDPRRRAGRDRNHANDLVMDALIAATAAIYDLVVVTRNVKDFRRLGTPILNPWRPAAG